MTTGSSSVAADRLQRGLLLLTAGLGVGLTPSALAHRTDEYLHAAFVGIRPAEVELYLSLTPGASVAAAVLAEMDTDHDGRISEAEQRTYAEFILSRLRLDLDETPKQPRLNSIRFPEMAALQDGTGVVELRATLSTAPFSAGSHHLRLRNQHTNHTTVYLANALQPETREIEILRQTRDLTQSDLLIQFAAHPLQSGPVVARSKSKHPWLPLAVALILALALIPALRAQPKRSSRT